MWDVKNQNKQIIYLVFRIMGWHGNKELDDIESKMTSKEKKEPHCVKCEHLGMFGAVYRGQKYFNIIALVLQDE